MHNKNDLVCNCRNCQLIAENYSNDNEWMPELIVNQLGLISTELKRSPVFHPFVVAPIDRSLDVIFPPRLRERASRYLFSIADSLYLNFNPASENPYTYIYSHCQPEIRQTYEWLCMTCLKLGLRLTYVTEDQILYFLNTSNYDFQHLIIEHIKRRIGIMKDYGDFSKIFLRSKIDEIINKIKEVSDAQVRPDFRRATDNSTNLMILVESICVMSVLEYSFAEELTAKILRFLPTWALRRIRLKLQQNTVLYRDVCESVSSLLHSSFPDIAP